MSKKQVIMLSFVVALPALGLLTAVVFGGLDHGGKMFSGLMTVFVAITALLALVLGGIPFAIMAFYPAQGFAGFAPPASGATATGGPTQPQSVDDDGDAANDDFDSGDEDDGFDDGGFDDDGFDDGGGDEMYADDEEYDDADDEEWA